jgi:hypothetical protein
MFIYVKIKKKFNLSLFFDNFMLIYVKIITKKNVFYQTDRRKDRHTFNSKQ